MEEVGSSNKSIEAAPATVTTQQRPAPSWAVCLSSPQSQQPLEALVSVSVFSQRAQGSEKFRHLLHVT